MDGVDYGGVLERTVLAKTKDLKDYRLVKTLIHLINYEDEIIRLDGSTQIVELANVLEAGVTYNVYLNNVRIDDPI